MAKRRSNPPSSANTTIETLGAALGRLTARLDAWRSQRAEIGRDLQDLIARAQTMLKDLTRGGFAEPSPSERKGGRPKGYKMSDETRAKLRAAWRRRKAREGGQSASAAALDSAATKSKPGRRKRATV